MDDVVIDPRHTEEVRRANLDKLATYLEGLPEDYGHFNMSSFLEDDGDIEALLDYARNNGGVHKCGSAACAVGHGPSSGILFNEDEIVLANRYNVKKGRWVNELVPNWDKYTERFCNFGKEEFEFLFGGEWGYHDDSHQGAAARIRYYLAHGIPECFIDTDEDGYQEYDYDRTISVVYDFNMKEIING